MATERHGASHRITQKLPGAVPNPGVRKTKLLPSAVRRTDDTIPSWLTEGLAPGDAGSALPSVAGLLKSKREGAR